MMMLLKQDAKTADATNMQSNHNTKSVQTTKTTTNKRLGSEKKGCVKWKCEPYANRESFARMCL